MKKFFSPKLVFYLAGLLLALGGGYWLGLTQGYYQRITAQNLWSTWQEQIVRYEKTHADFSLYTDVVELLQEKYYGDIDFLGLLYGSVKGAVASLGDSYTSFSTPAESRDFFTNLNGIYEGIGIEIDYIEDKLVVVTPLEGSPAATAGLLPKDEILTIDNTSTLGLGLDEAVRLIHGLKGTQVVLVVRREGVSKPLEFTLTRDLIKIPSIKLVSFADGLAVVEINKFSNDTIRLFNQVAVDLLANEVKGIVLDLRNNPGGFLDVGVKITNEFIKEGMIVEERFKDDKVIPFYADGGGRFTELPIVMLMNGGSASAAEILAGALKDNKRAILVGESTFGKGSVQEIEEMSDGSALRVTIAHWYTPSGQSISQGGIRPDILIEADQEGETDDQLERAMEELKKLAK